MDRLETFGARRPVVGMVHLPPLPGSPQWGGDRTAAPDRDAVLDRARADAAALVRGGVDAVLVENFGDAPFFPDDVPKHVVASMTEAVGAVRRTVDCPVGVNVLRNDADAALAVAAATGASFVRVNVHVGARVTDQGVVAGRAHETMRLRERLDANVAVLADVGVKHSAPLGDVPLETELRDAIQRGLADGVVVSGSGTGEAVAGDHLARAVAARNALGDWGGLDGHDAPDESAAPGDRPPVFVGSGVTPETVGDLLATADGVVVGTALKADGRTASPVDPARVAALVEAAGRS